MNQAVDFDDIARIPMEGDNAAIATRRLEAGTRYIYQDHVHALPHTVMEGHRFALGPIAAGEPLLSWGLPFGRAIRAIEPGQYICNAKILAALAQRSIDFPLPDEPNIEDHLAPFQLDEAAFRPGKQVEPAPEELYFEGYPRTEARGVGTRNCIVVLGTTSLTAGYARALEARMKGVADGYENIDGIVAVAHTEGGGEGVPNNLDFLLRTLSGFMVHPNIGAVLAVDYGTEPVTNGMLREYMEEQGYPLAEVPHRFFSIESDFSSALAEGEAIVRGWLDEVNGQSRRPSSVSNLKIALQCGGSDAFSGVAGNPLAGWVAKEVIRHGGSANLAETDELIGAEAYILSNIRDLPTAKKFLEKIAIFKERARWHGHSVEGNPSGGNNFRGLYNIAIKSIGAARKKDPEVRLDYVIDYGQRMSEPGYYFMDSPGNDLESIGGQVASGSNVIFFITGNGSVTNFPFVPTIKFVTTTGRYELLSKDMDVNAGRYQDGVPMEKLGAETFGYMMKVAAGTPSLGERAGHSQVSIWRNWNQQSDARLAELQVRPAPDGQPIAVKPGPAAGGRLSAVETDGRFATEQVGLVVPTSLCSAQIARKVADELNARDFAKGRPISRMVALVHTEGCGASGGENEGHFMRTVVGHLVHPNVRTALLLEHGCEKVHNDAMRHRLTESGIDLERFGWASVQLDGGIDAVMEKVVEWFAGQIPQEEPPQRKSVGLEALSLGLMTVGDVPDAMARALGRTAAGIVRAGGTVVVAGNGSVLGAAPFLDELTGGEPLAPTLEYGEPAARQGLHVMSAPTTHGVETLTGMGGTGVHAVLAHVAGPPLPAHPLVPVIQASADPKTVARFKNDLDRVFGDGETDPEAISAALDSLVLDSLSGAHKPRARHQGNIDFQFTRGWLGLSM